MSYKILALDLDGTLTDDHKKLTPFTKECLYRAMDRGVKIVLASGRPDLGITALAEELKMYEKGGFILAFNGARIIDCKTGEIVSETHLPSEYFDEIIKTKSLFPDVEVLTYTDKEIITENITDYVREESRCLSCDIKTVEDLKSSLPSSVVKFLIVGEHEKLEPVQGYLNKKFGGKFNAYFSQPFFLEVVPNGIDKASSLRRLLDYCSFAKEEFMACGDGFNDIPMLQEAGLPVAMENAYPEVKPYAKFITKSNNDDGVGYAVEKFILNEKEG